MANSGWKALQNVFALGRKTCSPFPTVSLRLESLESRETPAAFAVNTADDTPDIAPGDGKALDANGNTSLRAAIQEVNALGEGLNLIGFPTAVIKGQPPPTMTITLQTNSLDQIKVNVDIFGSGKDYLTINGGGNGVVGVFSVAKDVQVTIGGMTIAGGVNAANKGGGTGRTHLICNPLWGKSL